MCLTPYKQQKLSESGSGLLDTGEIQNGPMLYLEWSENCLNMCLTRRKCYLTIYFILLQPITGSGRDL